MLLCVMVFFYFIGVLLADHEHNVLYVGGDPLVVMYNLPNNFSAADGHTYYLNGAPPLTLLFFPTPSCSALSLLGGSA